MSQKNKIDLSEFFVTPTNIWKEKILDELNKKNYEDILWEHEGIKLAPFYISDDLKTLHSTENFHSFFASKSPRHWYTRATLHYSQKNLNASIKKKLSEGYNAIEINNEGTVINSNEINEILKDINVHFFPVHFRTAHNPQPIVDHFSECNQNEVKGSIYYGALSGKKVFLYLDSLAKCLKANENLPNFRILGLDSTVFHSQKSGMVKEIAFTIALALDYFDQLSEENISPKEILRNFEFSFSISEKFFQEIAKLRAFRLVWNQISNAIDPSFNSFSTPVHCKTSELFLTKEDPYTNIIRNTTSSMSAVIGGCDSITINPFDKEHENEFSERISKNISLILKQESYFDKIADPSGGAYYIEYLTYLFAEKSLEIIKQIEGEGGFQKAFGKGLIS